MATEHPTTPTSHAMPGASGAGLILAAPTAGAAKAAELDGELLAACAGYEAARIAFQEHAASIVGNGDQAFDDATDALTIRQCDAMDEVIACGSPSTPEGLRALASVAYQETYFAAKPWRDEPVEKSASRAQRLALVVLRSVAGEG